MTTFVPQFAPCANNKQSQGLTALIGKSVLITLLALLPALSQAGGRCSEAHGKSNARISDTPTFTALRAVSRQEKPLGLTLREETFNRRSRATKKTATYSNVIVDGRGIPVQVMVTLEYVNKESDGKKPARWELLDSAYVQAGQRGSEPLTGQVISISRSQKVVKTVGDEVMTREFLGTFEAHENWTVILNISKITDSTRPNETPQIIYLGSALL